jgi:molybdate transport system substrate-binding protein
MARQSAERARVVRIKVLSTHAVQDVLHEFVPAFERARQVSLVIDYDPANALKRRIEDGVSFDVAIVTRPVVDALIGQGMIASETVTDIARSGLGVAIRKGAAKPDISTTDTFKRALINARSVVRSHQGTSGLYFETLLTRLGIAETMRGKIILGGSGRIAELVARGEAELAVQQIPELLPVDGVDFAGPLPEELQLYTVFSAGVSATCATKEAAKAFIDGLAAPAVASLFKAKGLEPMPR